VVETENVRLRVPETREEGRVPSIGRKFQDRGVSAAAVGNEKIARLIDDRSGGIDKIVLTKSASRENGSATIRREF